MTDKTKNPSKTTVASDDAISPRELTADELDRAIGGIASGAGAQMSQVAAMSQIPTMD